MKSAGYLIFIAAVHAQQHFMCLKFVILEGGCLVMSNCKMGRLIKKVENSSVRRIFERGGQEIQKI